MRRASERYPVVGQVLVLFTLWDVGMWGTRSLTHTLRGCGRDVAWLSQSFGVLFGSRDVAGPRCVGAFNQPAGDGAVVGFRGEDGDEPFVFEFRAKVLDRFRGDVDFGGDASVELV